MYTCEKYTKACILILFYREIVGCYYQLYRILPEDIFKTDSSIKVNANKIHYILNIFLKNFAQNLL